MNISVRFRKSLFAAIVIFCGNTATATLAHVTFSRKMKYNSLGWLDFTVLIVVRRAAPTFKNRG